MQMISLTFYQRVILQNICGNHQVSSLGEASTYLRLIEKLRPTDQEAMDTQFISANGQFGWQLPTTDYGSINIELEGIEAQALVNAIENSKPVKVNDAQWMLELINKLSFKGVTVAN